MGALWNYACNFSALFRGKPPVRPLLFSYYVTHRCALRCTYCSDGEGRPFADDIVPELSTEDAMRLIDLLSLSCNQLDVTGGEPLLREDLGTILAHARARGMQTILNTKGQGLAQRTEVFAATDVMVLSLDSLEPARLSKITGRTVAAAMGMRNELAGITEACARRGCKLILSCVAMPDNLGDVEAVQQFAQEHGLGFQVSPQIVGTMVHPALRDHPAYTTLIQRLQQAKREGGAILGVPEYLRGLQYFSAYRCYPQLMPVIRPDGRLYYPCLESKQADIYLLDYPSYEAARKTAEQLHPRSPDCGRRCHIFCHMALSLFQSHPLSALGEAGIWRRIKPISKRQGQEHA